ncbi:CorA metal ion transporter [Podila humilis]|nr:CorA metal ion transporter [Podila humilis]
MSPPHGGDPASVYRFSHGVGNTPSIRSERTQHLRPYSPSIRNGYPPGGQQQPHFQLNPQHSQHHRSLDTYGHHPDDGSHSHRDIERGLVIDYPGLDDSVTAAFLHESGFNSQPLFLGFEGIEGTKGAEEVEGAEGAAGTAGTVATAGTEGTESKNDIKDTMDSTTVPSLLNRAASTGSSGLLGRTPSNSAFRRRSARKASFYSERAPRPPLPESPRYTFYTQATGMIQAVSLPQILANAPSPQGGGLGSDDPVVFSDLLKRGCYWLDILDPSDFDMQILSRHFHIHPLTIEDISTEEIREKYEVFRHYYFVCFRTFDQDYNSGSYLQPASMYSVVLRDGIITFHFRPTNHHLNVLRRIEQLQSHITLTPDWINYALLDDITDSFASPIQTVEYEVDSIDELVLLLRENETADMLQRIGVCRKNVMAMSRLLANKADVLRGLMKRFDERYAVAPLIASTRTDMSPMSMTAPTSAPLPTVAATVRDDAVKRQWSTEAKNSLPEPPLTLIQHSQHGHHRDGDILLYLGDILDHVLTMLQSLSGYEKVLDRSHSNYLAQISLEINQLSNKMNQVVGTLTFFASLIVPMTFISGLWG